MVASPSLRNCVIAGLALAIACVIALTLWLLWPTIQGYMAVRTMMESLPSLVQTDAKYGEFYDAVRKIRRYHASQAAVESLVTAIRAEGSSHHVQPPPFTASMKSMACFALGRLGPEAAPAVEVLVEVLNEPDTECRLQAARALGWIGPAAGSAVQPLRRAQDDRDSRVRRWATAAILKIEGGSAAIDPLMSDLKSPAFCERILAADALANIGSDAIVAVPALIQALSDEKADVRDAAAKALRRIDPDAAAKAGIP